MLPAGIDQRDVRTNAGKGHRRSLVNLNAQAVREQSASRSPIRPRNLLQLLLALGERDEENVAADIAAHDFHDLRVRYVFSAGDFNLIARIDAEAPGVLAVA